MNVLENFSSINIGVKFLPGNTLRTMSPQKTIIAEATLPDTIDGEAAVYDMKRFLATLSLFDDPDIKFGKDRFTISTDKAKATYVYAADNMILIPPSDLVLIEAMEETDTLVNVSWVNLQRVIRGAGVLGLEHIIFSMDNDSLYLGTKDVKDPTSDTFHVKLGEVVGAENYSVAIATENMKLLKADYSVQISKRGVIRFAAPNIEYLIACEVV